MPGLNPGSNELRREVLMTDRIARFDRLVRETLVPYYCTNPRMNCQPSGFDEGRKAVDPVDIDYFLMAWDSDLLYPIGEGQYGAPLGSASEMLFWEGPKDKNPRPFWLWLEPIITFGGLARLHLDFNWPAENLGAQSPDGAFDIVAHSDPNSPERIAGEVKKTKREVDRLIDLMVEYGADPAASALAGEKGRNAFKKVQGLRARQAPIFWALGPAGYSRAFAVRYDGDGAIYFHEVDQRALLWSSERV